MKNGDVLVKEFSHTLNTDGSGLYSTVRQEVQTTRMECIVGSFDEPGDRSMWGELRVYFDTATWNNQDYGLIYTDHEFLDELKGYLELNGFDDGQIGYSEQGMQGEDYVSLDVDEDFVQSWVLNEWLKSDLVGL